MPIDTGSVSKLRDDLKASQSKFNISSYLTSSEASKYLSELPGLEDIISAIKGIIDTISKFAEMILGFLEKILAFLNLNKIVDALGLRSLLNFISSLIGSGLGIVGLSAGDRAGLNGLFNSACLPIGAATFSNGYDMNVLERFSILALILGLSCSLPGLAFTEMYTIMNNTTEITTIKTEITSLQVDATSAANNPVFIFDAVANDYLVDQAKTDANVAAIELKIAELQLKLDDITTQIDYLFAGMVPMIYSNADKIENMQSASILGLTEELSNHSVIGLVRDNNLNLADSVIKSIDTVVVNNSDVLGETAIKGEDTTKVDGPLYGMIENKLCPTIPLTHSTPSDANTLTAVMKELPQDMSVVSLVESIKRIDATVSIQSLSSSTVIKALSLRELGSQILPSNGLVTSCPTLVIEDISRYLA